MRNFHNSKPLQISLIISLVLHMAIFVYFYLPKPRREETKPPIFVEYISPQASTETTPSFKGTEVKPIPKLKAGKPAPAETEPAHEPEQNKVSETASTTENAAEQPESHPMESTKTPPLPGKEALIPSLDQLSKEKGEKKSEVVGDEGDKDEETISLDSTDFKYTSYLHGVKFKIEGVWKYPEAAKKSALQGGGLVSFTILRDGTLGDLRLLNSSGYPVLDEAILKAIRDAAPFNPMTENMRVKRLNVVATFEYNMVMQRLWGR